MFYNSNMYSTRDPTTDLTVELHLAQIVALLGLPPADFVERSETAMEYFNADGKLSDAPLKAGTSDAHAYVCQVPGRG